jgi:hypothetical protein
MSKDLCRFSLFSCLLVILPLLIGSCLNPVNFNEEDLPTIKVNVSGTVDVTVKDVAVMWLVNRTKTVDVREFKIERSRFHNEKDEQYVYPKIYTSRPAAGTSLASYHSPAELYYKVSVAAFDTGTQVIKSFTFEVQFPRAADYRYYLYWTVSGELVLVDDTKMTQLPPDPGRNFPNPEPSSLNAQTFVILNVNPDQNLDEVEFVRDTGTYVIAGEPRAKDQKMLLLGSGSYVTTARYTKNGTSHATTRKNIVVTREDGSMAARTNFAYFYKTKSGDYQISQNWPPIPNDASEDNRPEDALTEGQGILEITNGANPSLAHDIVARVEIGGTVYPSGTNNLAYMVPGDVNRYILSVGTVNVSFKPTDQTHYGQAIPREISSRAVTKLTYTNNMGNPDFIPEDQNGYGAGLVRITNDTTGVVANITVYDKDDLSKSVSLGYGDFTPPYPIQYGKVGRVPVYGTPEFPLRKGLSQIIQVSLETAEGFEVIQRVAALRGQIVDIVLNQSDLNPGGGSGGRYGSGVTVRNQTDTSTNILGMYVYNKANAASSAVYFLDISSPPSKEKKLYVLSTIGLPIIEGQNYAARLSVYGNGKIALIDKNFNEGSDLYSANPDSHERTITLNQSDLPPELIENFVAVTGITLNSYMVTSYTESNLDGSDPAIVYNGAFNFNNIAVVSPPEATKKFPIEWELVPGGGSQYVSLTGNVFTVTGIAPEGNRTVTVKAVIRDGAGVVAAKTDFTTTVNIELAYHNTGTRTKKVVDFTLASGMEVQERGGFDLRTLANLSPNDANINGVPITANDLEWRITASDNTGSSVSGCILTAGTPGTVTIQALLPALKSSTGGAITKTQTVRITSMAPSIVPVSGISLTNTSPLQVDFYTKTLNGAKSVYDTGSLYLSPYAAVSPSNASVQSPIVWSLESGNTGAVEIDNTNSAGLLRVKTSLSGGQIPGSGNNKVWVKATIPNGAGNGIGVSSPAVEITLVERHSAPVQPGGLSLKPATIQIGESITLNTLATIQAGAMYDNALLTTADLEWSIVYGDAPYGTLSNGVFTGKAVGKPRLRAVLPAAKNLGEERSAETTITITVAKSSTFTLRIIKVPTIGDGVVQVVLVPVTNDRYSEAVYKTGYTGVAWATSNDTYHGTHLNEFKKMYPPGANLYFTVSKFDSQGTSAEIRRENEWADIVVPWPTGNVTGYHLFFVETDLRVRGYCTLRSSKTSDVLDASGDPERNFLFFIRPDYLHANRLLPMGVTREDGYKQANSFGSPYSFRWVIPISYTDWENVPSIMTSAGIGYRPLTNHGSIKP